jgi:DnaD/phage-associated family protein
MSGLIVGLVIRTPISDELVSTAKYVAIIYADHAWEDGTHAYPAVETVAGVMGIDTRTVQRHLRKLEKIGMLISDGKGPRGTNKYRFPLVEGSDGSVRLALVGGGVVSPRQIARGDTDSGDTDSGDMGVTQIIKPSDLIVVKAGAGENFRIYEQEIGALTPMIADAIRDAEETYPPEWIPEAIAIAVENNARNWKYVEAILKNCKAAGKRPSLNRLEAKHANSNTSNSKRNDRSQSKKSDTVYSDADRAAADAINNL